MPPLKKRIFVPGRKEEDEEKAQNKSQELIRQREKAKKRIQESQGATPKGAEDLLPIQRASGREAEGKLIDEENERLRQEAELKKTQEVTGELANVEFEEQSQTAVQDEKLSLAEKNRGIINRVLFDAVTQDPLTGEPRIDPETGKQIEVTQLSSPIGIGGAARAATSARVLSNSKTTAQLFRRVGAVVGLFGAVGGVITSGLSGSKNTAVEIRQTSFDNIGTIIADAEKGIYQNNPTQAIIDFQKEVDNLERSEAALIKIRNGSGGIDLVGVNDELVIFQSYRDFGLESDKNRLAIALQTGRLPTGVTLPNENVV